MDAAVNWAQESGGRCPQWGPSQSPIKVSEGQKLQHSVLLVNTCERSPVENLPFNGKGNIFVRSRILKIQICCGDFNHSLPFGYDSDIISIHVCDKMHHPVFHICARQC